MQRSLADHLLQPRITHVTYMYVAHRIGDVEGVRLGGAGINCNERYFFLVPQRARLHTATKCHTLD